MCHRILRDKVSKWIRRGHHGLNTLRLSSRKEHMALNVLSGHTEVEKTLRNSVLFLCAEIFFYGP